MDAASLLLGVLFSGIGLGFFIYGRKQNAGIPMLSGVLLLVFPYFVANIYLMLAIGIALILLPCFVKA